jgi:hypothetical protein
MLDGLPAVRYNITVEKTNIENINNIKDDMIDDLDFGCWHCGGGARTSVCSDRRIFLSHGD